MSFDSRLSRLPRAFDADRGAERRAVFSDLPGPLCDLIEGAAGSSPYLDSLLMKEGDWIRAAFDDPEAAFDVVMEDVRALELAQLSDGLRQAKRRVALLTGLADLSGVWPLETVTQCLSDFADAAVDICLKRLVAAEIARGKIPGLTEADAETAGGMVVLSMGKGGAGELNYSSDIDLIVLFDEQRFDESNYQEARAAFVRVTRKMTGLLADVTAQGYVFRTDLRLRPDASVMPVCIPMIAAEQYYESVGRTWERAAYIKARSAAGDIEAGERFLETLRPFVWRKHLDFASIQDAHDMRLRIRDHKGLHGPLNLNGHNIKLGRGGIREIEFFTQTRQLIAGGRDPSLRVRDTKTGLQRLADAGWVPPSVAEQLYDHYVFHREVEHRVQMLNDQQTHALPKDKEGWERLACFMGRDTGELKMELKTRFEAVHELTEDFFAPTEVEEVDRARVSDFAEGYEDAWMGYPALRSERAKDIFKRLKPEIYTRLQEAAKPEEALRNFDGFLRGLPAGVQLFSLFEANPQLTQLIVDICATAPALSAYLSRNSAVLDMVLSGSFFSKWPEVEALRDDLDRAMEEAGDYEDQLNLARRWMKEWHFRIGVHHLRGIIDAKEAGAQYADLAEAVISGLYPRVVTEFSRKYGPPPGRGAMVLGMGSLGARRLNAFSDLDLIVIYDAQGVEASDGPKSLATRPYYARLTQALLTAVTAPMSDGRLYEVDMRLRPSGRQGPVATSVASFAQYQREEAWTWEHLALTRARSVGGSAEIADEVEAFRQTLLAEKAGGETVLTDVADMRRRISAAKAPAGAYDAKIGSGRLQDVELCAQTAALRAGSAARDVGAQIAAGVESGWLDAADEAALRGSADLYWSLQAAARLLTGETLNLEEVGEGGRRFILRETGFETIEALETEMQERAAAADAVITRLLGEGSGDA